MTNPQQPPEESRPAPEPPKPVVIKSDPGLRETLERSKKPGDDYETR